jgi:ribosome-binding protein aMBF1 (putative translation factor)
MARRRPGPQTPEEKIESRLSEHRIREHTKQDSGAHDPPLPDPAERRRIREAAGLTQRDVAAELGVHQSLISYWEKAGPLGYNERGEHFPKREPIGERRRQYAALLKMMEGRRKRFYDA